jgi:hypothetical protein
LGIKVSEPPAAVVILWPIPPPVLTIAQKIDLS